MKWLIALVGILLCTPALADYKIGVSAPLTGPNASIAEISLPGIKQAVADINAEGGVNGQRLALDVVDDACDPKQGITAANKLIAGGAVAVIQASCSGVAQASADIYEDEGVPLLLTLASNPDITKQKRAMVFRPAARDDGDAGAAVRFIADRLPARKVAVVHDKTTWGKGIAEIVAAGLKEKQFDTTIFEVNAGASDFGALIARLKSERYTLVYPALYMREAGLLVRQMAAQSYQPVVVGSVLEAMQDFITIAGPAREGLYFTVMRTTQKGRVIQKKLGMGDNQSGAYLMQSYAGVEVLADALRRSTGTAASLPVALREGTYQTILGELKFDAHGDVSGLDFAMYQYKDGRPVVVE